MDLISYAIAKNTILNSNGLKISKIEINADNELIITLSSGEVINAGKLPTADTETLNNIKKQIENLATKEEVNTTNEQIIKNVINLNERLDGVLISVDQIAASQKEDVNTLADIIKTNTNSINGINITLEEYLGKINNNTSNIAIFSGRIEENKEIINKHNSDIVDLQSIVKTKANAIDTYTKEQIGKIDENETIVSMIKKIENETSQNNIFIQSLISEISDKEESNRIEIDKINETLITLVENDEKNSSSIKELADLIKVCEDNVEDIEEKINKNSIAIMNLQTNLPEAILKAIKVDNVTVSNNNGVLSVKEVTTDMIQQGELLLVLNGGSAFD